MSGDLRRPGIGAVVADPANLLTLGGLVLAICGTAFAAIGRVELAVAMTLLAVLCDWWDGRVARATAGRAQLTREFGGQLDSLADLVSGGINPAMVLLAAGGFAPQYWPGALAVAVAGAVRLAYFNVVGLDVSGRYRGLPIVHNTPAIALVVLATPLLGSALPVVLYAVVVCCAVLHVSSLSVPKITGWGVYVFTAFCVVAAPMLIVLDGGGPW
ncbi:CDP-diacylglycerol--serine O-phosphatidyltransferase [Saccharothrix ecbatanensis]|uniref:CDP-diacylglycerol--serine O-phosphatidyltransferase n=1 Tax=Saccharothrix ecbatanensis TaxID=1105145 RepID=A0A7W9HS72_9PSEU|nr:CDP-alcohol phosphatidyltransferase family protein [Saccharothrix ecbatanensis]MBB5807469.1 CDP-diacylglycerol--serine O-phosphatidyltransferase [Saccharothrix ecbatanensis]